MSDLEQSDGEIEDEVGQTISGGTRVDRELNDKLSLGTCAKLCQIPPFHGASHAWHTAGTTTHVNGEVIHGAGSWQSSIRSSFMC